ncbi:recombination-associated protein RdgC [Halopseudomonas pachastrellae]|nr:recombination-associated protein RdgC [Halopseudomonas pachastrellae]
MQIGDDCELRDTSEDGGVVRCKRQDLASDEIQLHLSAGKQVSQLMLQWQEKLSFSLDDKLTLKRVKFEDLLRGRSRGKWRRRHAQPTGRQLHHHVQHPQ